MIIKGKTHILGDDINTDDIIAAKYLDSQDEKFLGSKLMENLDKGFAARVKKNDIIVAGRNFGCGSSREHAPWSIMGAGASLVIAKSFARIFYRNCINLGLPILVFSQTQKIKPGDKLEVNLEKGIIKNLTKNEEYICDKFPSFMTEIINKGGLMNWVKNRHP